MRLLGVWVALVIVGCGSGGNGGTCGHDPSLADAGAGVIACGTARTALSCSMPVDPTAGPCNCISDSETCYCGSSCQHRCADDEYAIACGGGVPPSAHQSAPASCVMVAMDRTGTAIYCCLCQ
jgi:hypothetical protein